MLDGFAVEVFDTIDSTNAVAKTKPPFSLIAADRQTLGRGRLGKSFFSPEGGIYMSMVMPKKELATIRTAVAVSESLEQFTSQKLQIKWVNDLFSQGRKVAGILCELAEDKIIVGVGININRSEFPDDISNIAGAVNISAPREAVIAKIAQRLLEVWNADKIAVMSEYKSRLFILGKSIEYTLGGEKHSGIAEDINCDGNLVVRAGDEVHILNSGEISLSSGNFSRQP